MYIRITFIAYFLFLTVCTQATCSDSDSVISFKGLNYTIAYTKGRQLNEAFFILKNKSNSKVRVDLSAAHLIRGNTVESLNGLLIKDNQFPKGNSYIYLNPGVEKKVRIIFSPFKLYEGSVYNIRAEVMVNEKKYSATSQIGLFRQAYGDKHKYKE